MRTDNTCFYGDIFFYGDFFSTEIFSTDFWD